MMDFMAMGEYLKKNLSIVISLILIVSLIALAKFYLEPLSTFNVTVENALYAKWAGFSAVFLIMMIMPKYLRFPFSLLLLCCVFNTIALAVNDGYMPVASLSCIYVEGHHTPFYETARLPFLCDWILGYASIGDLFYVLFLPVYLLFVWRFRS